MIETVTEFKLGYSFISTIRARKTYYSSAWTGRISREEQAEINAKEIISKRLDESLNDRIQNMILYGVAFNNNGRDVNPYDLYQTTFEPDPRYEALMKKIEWYDKCTPDEMNNRDALPYSRELSKWRKDRGYTQEEFNRAKRDYFNMRKSPDVPKTERQRDDTDI